MHLRLLLFFILYQSTLIGQTNTININGQILDSKTKKGVPFANLIVEELNNGVICDAQGKFKLNIKYLKKANIKITRIGYAVKDTIIDAKNTSLKIFLEEQSIALEEFTITAKYTNRTGSEAVIDEKTLEYIQPTSIRDVFVLLPGGQIGLDNIENRFLMDSRQAGKDQSTSFGMGISMDGIPLTDDGKRVQMSAYTGKVAIDYDNNVAVNSGVDLRAISTDHIQKIAVSRGISSAKEGNLSSGLIKITSKQGESPFRLRIKSDPLNDLLYIGKGLLLSEKLGTLHIGADITKSSSDVRELRSSYNRITGQINYNNKFYINGNNTDFNFRTSYVQSFNDKKTDALIDAFKEDYENKYSKLSLSSNITASLDNFFVDKLELLTSLQHTKDVLIHKKFVYDHGASNFQNSIVEGENEAIFLPSEYYSTYTIDNEPLNFFSSLSATKSGLLNDRFNYNFLYGTSISYIKNIGKGIVLNSGLPPFPSNKFIRPRRNIDIPALVNNSSFLETKFGYRTEKHKLNISLGLRGTKMLNLPKNYYLNKKYLLEPRLQASYTLVHNSLSNTLWTGFGTENKLPSIDYLYPDNEYQDLTMLSAYSDNPNEQLVITNTVINKTTNPKLRENKNKKIEIGFDTKYKKHSISLSVFKEVMNGGIEYFMQYKPVSYWHYHKRKIFAKRKPTKDDFEYHWKKDFVFYRKPHNSSKIIKKGLEYRINIPKIPSIKSDIQINGAYYYTIYTNGIPVMYRPPLIEDEKPFPYVGLYQGYDKNYQQRVNSNIWVNTHIPKLKLIFTNFIQLVWLKTSQLGTNVSVYPKKYLDLDGNVIDFKPTDIFKDRKFKSLSRTFDSARYNEKKQQMELRMNFKITKEFNSNIKLSFYANNIIQHNPEFITSLKRKINQWYKPFFGAELILNF